MATKTNRRPPIASHKKPPKPSWCHTAIFWSIGGALVIAAAVLALLWSYQGRTLPNVQVASVTVNHKTPEQVKQIVAAQQKKMTLTLTNKGVTRTISAAEAGVTIDVEATVHQVMQTRRTGKLTDRLQLWSAQNVALVFHNDPGKLRAYMQQNYPELFVDAKDAQLTFNPSSNIFDIVAGTNGQGFDINTFEAALPSLAVQPRNIPITLATKPVEPLITAKNLEPVQQQANQRVSLPLEFTINGRVIYKASPDQIASWAHFVPDAVARTARLEFDKTAITNFINNQVAPTVTTTSIPRKVLVDSQTGAQTVLQAGRNGYQLKDTDSLATDVMNALNDNKPFNRAVSVDEAPFTTITMTGADKWIEVDLGRQRVTLYVDQTAIQSFTISSGKANTPTQIGVSAVYSKLPVQTMTGTIAGDYYYVPNVKWVSYFNGGEAFHGTYWHSNFGHPMSHGCINMTETDAKILYDFAPIGTKVVVHA